MKRLHGITAVALAAGLFCGASVAANLANLSGQSCGTGGTGTWHFVNNQTGGAAPGTLTASFTENPTQCITAPSAVNQNVQHFLCAGGGALLGASTDLPGRLVLSDFSCAPKDPPVCVPTKDNPCPPK